MILLGIVELRLMDSISLMIPGISFFVNLHCWKSVLFNPTSLAAALKKIYRQWNKFDNWQGENDCKG